jgi:hypothetical protein
LSAAAVLAIVVAVGEGHSPATTVMLATVEESLGAGVALRLLEVPEATEAEALRAERELTAGAVFTLRWMEPARLHAVLRVHFARNNRWTTREMTFAAGDSLAERGRTLGLVVASMWPEAANVTRDRPAPAEVPPSAPALPPAAPVTPSPPPAAASITGPSPSPRGELATQSPAPALLARPAAPRRFWTGVSAVGTIGVGGPASGLGAGAEGVLCLDGTVALRVGASLRNGSLPELPGSDLVGTLAAGVEWRSRPASRGRPLALGIRADVLALRHEVRGTGAGGETETQRRVLPGADLLGQAVFRLAPRVEVVTGLGVEVAFGTTDIRMGNARVTVATIPALRPMAEAGLRVGF